MKFNVHMQVAIARAWAVAKHNFHRAVAYLVGHIGIDAAIKLAARFHGAQAARAL